LILKIENRLQEVKAIYRFQGKNEKGAGRMQMIDRKKKLMRFTLSYAKGRKRMLN